MLKRKATWTKKFIILQNIRIESPAIRIALRALSKIFETGRKAKSDLVETEIAVKREYRSYENYAWIVRLGFECASARHSSRIARSLSVR